MTDAVLRYTDVSLTDGQSARWAGGLTTPMALALAERLAAARPAAVEIASLATLQQCVARGENPWQRIELLRERCPGVPLRAALSLLTDHGRRGSDVITTEVATLWLRELAQRGVSEILLIDPLAESDRITLQEAESQVASEQGSGAQHADRQRSCGGRSAYAMGDLSRNPPR